MTATFSLELEPIEFPEGDPYRDPAAYRAGERFWWHNEIAEELRRLEAQGFSAACTKQIAGNIRRGEYDTAKNLRMMLTWGEVVRADALSDFEPDTWVRLAAVSP